MQRGVTVTSFYRFVPVEPARLDELKLRLEELAAADRLSGLIIIAPEGCNGTIAGSAEAIDRYKEALFLLFGGGDWRFKDSSCSNDPFPRFKVRIRPEIVTSGLPELQNLTDRLPSPAAHTNGSLEKDRHLTPLEWQAVLESGEDIVLLDTRNRYETALGKFSGAVDPEIDCFQDLSGFLDREELPRDKKILMYCTGGIRCEKAIVEMQMRGYENLFQLDGGILRYLEQFPHNRFEGECFVFDGRVALDQSLAPTERWSLCPHCGDPGETWIGCAFCGTDARLCDSCINANEHPTCSHDCAYKVVHQRSRARNLAHCRESDLPVARKKAG